MRSWIWPTAALLAILAASCGDDDAAPPVPLTIDAGADVAVESCATVMLMPIVTGVATDVRWSSTGLPLLALDEGSRGSVLFRAPAVVVPTELQLEVVAESASGEVASDSLRVTVAAAPVADDLADGMARDCAPFTAGVASGDPTADGVVLWTYVNDDRQEVSWQVATDPLFRDLVAEGRAFVDPGSGTVHVDVQRLASDTRYFYRFLTMEGMSSALGRTRTAPHGAAASARFAVASCSSIYSGYFNAYRRIAERDDLDLVIHLGDYIYDFVDAEEQVRVPEPFPQVPLNEEEWAARHEYYLADPDLRLARAMHPWFMLWDNHDVESSAAPTYNGSVDAFRRWNPMRMPDSGRPEIAYRTLSWGELVELYAIDILLFRELDPVPGTNAPSILGDEQWAWLEPTVERSTATWRLFGMQKPFGQLRINPEFSVAIGGERRDIFDPGTWDGFPEDRARFLAMLDDNDLIDNLFLSGDSHISIGLNVVDDFDMPTRALGAELLPTSISRGNFDEALGALAQERFLQFLVEDTLRRNPHGVYLQLTKHGYGTLAIDADEIQATYWYSEILARSDEEEEGPTLVLHRGLAEWSPR